MAAEITHIVLAELAFNRLFKGKNKRNFFIGNSFPDIRYLGVIRRDQTHFLGITLSEIVNEKSSFWRGMKFHSWVDQTRSMVIFSNPEILTLEKGFSRPEHLRFHIALKLLEDEILYPKVSNWLEKISFLDNFLPEEESFDIPEEAIKRWHRILQDNFSMLPSDQTRSNFFRVLGITEGRIGKINQMVNRIRREIKIVRAINDLYLRFEDLLRG